MRYFSLFIVKATIAEVHHYALCRSKERERDIISSEIKGEIGKLL